MFHTILLFLSLTTLVNGQTDVSGCIASNITLTFTPAIDPKRTVSSYTWNKDIGPNRDPSFAKFEPSTKQLQTFMDDINGRLFHDPKEAATLHITDLRESDAAKYTIVVRYVIFDGKSPEDVVNLSVKDVCFEKPKQVGKCAITTCYTGTNGVLKTPMGKEETVNGYKLVKVCEGTNSGNYSCCNAADKCQSLTLAVFRGTTPPMDQTGTETTIGIVLGVLAALGIIAAAIGCFLKQRQTQKAEGKASQIEQGNNQDPEKEPL